MHELWVVVERIEGACSGPVPMVPGTGFLVRDGSLYFPGGGPICLFALSSLLPLFPAKERPIEEGSEDWLGRVHHAQCPDPKGRTIWRIDRREPDSTPIAGAVAPELREGDLLISVERVEGHCTAGMAPGRTALLRGSSLYLPQPFCLYAMQALLPLLPAMQRPLEPDDWMASENAVLCPDPAGNVVLRIDRVQGGASERGRSEDSAD